MVLGAQLYTLRDYIRDERDIRFTLAQVAKMGYTTVQVSGMGPIDPQVLREICEENGLRVVLTHTDPVRIMNDTDAVIREHDILGCDYIGIGAMPEKYRTAFWLPHFAADFKEPARRIAAAGKKLMYHNHNFEWEKLPDGKRIIEQLLEDFSADELGVTLDTYWVQAAGADVCAWLEILRERIACVHLKDMAVHGFTQVMAPVMEGNMNFDAILDKITALGTVEYLLVEQDVCEGSPFDCLQTSYNNLKARGFH